MTKCDCFVTWRYDGDKVDFIHEKGCIRNQVVSYAQEQIDYLIEKDKMPHEELAIMTDVRMGLDDRDRVALMFTVTTADGLRAGQWIVEVNALDLIRESGVNNIKYLEGKPCIVTKDSSSMFYKRMFKV